MVNSKFHLIRSYCEIFFYNFPNIPCFKINLIRILRLIRSKTLQMNDFELTVPDLYIYCLYYQLQMHCSQYLNNEFLLKY